MEKHRGDQPAFNFNSHAGNPCNDQRPNFSDNHPRRRYHHQYSHMNAEPSEFFCGQPTPFPGRKREFHNSAHGASPDYIDCGIPAKLYVAPVPTTATEEDIRPLFEEHGNVVEVILPRDKKTGQQQRYIFLKYTTFDEADRAIRALNGQFTFAGELAPIKVRYAGERDRISNMALSHKLYVGCLNRQASKEELEEIFSQYGHVEDAFIVRDQLKQSRGCGFVQFSHGDMALAAIKGLHGIFTMRGSDQPLIVRFADPKKPRTGELRDNYAFGSPTFGSNSQEPVRSALNLSDSMGGHILPNAPYPMQHISINSQPQAFSHWANQEAAAPIVTQQLYFSQQLSSSQLSQVALQQMHTPMQSSQSSQQAVYEMQKQLHARHPLTHNLEQQQNSQVPRLESPRTGNNPQTSTSTTPTVPQSPQTAASLECDWSEHTCPDGDKYYYNCVTCESTWDKPEEFILFEQQLQKQQKLQNPNQQLCSQLSVLSTQNVAQTQVLQLQTHL